MVENAVDDPWFGDECADAHPFTAGGTHGRIDLEEASQQLGPSGAVPGARPRAPGRGARHRRASGRAEHREVDLLLHRDRTVLRPELHGYRPCLPVASVHHVDHLFHQGHAVPLP